MYDPYGNKQPQQNPQLFDDTSSYGYNTNQGYPNNQYNSGQAPVSRNQNTFMQPSVASQFVQDPLVTNMAMQYGQNLVGQGRQIVDEKIEKYVNISKNWSIRFNSEDDEPVQPRYDINAPDLYIPVMAFVTYVIIAGLSLGLQNRFSPDILGMQASWAVVWLALELAGIVVSFHVMSIQSKMQTLHLLALSSYKYVGMIVCLIGGIIVESVGYYSALAYCSLSFLIFTFRSLRCHLQGDQHSMEGYSVGTKRRFYLLVAISSLQPLIMWLLTRQLTSYSKEPIPNPLNP